MDTLNAGATNKRITGISSMATRKLLLELAQAYSEISGIAVLIESVGGVDALRRVQSGEPFDVVVLAADAIEVLIVGGHVAADSRTDLLRSRVAIGVKSGAERPDVSSEEALRQTVLAARTLGYSTGPSGTALLKLFERWGISVAVRERLVQAPPGVPVAQLVASGEIELGFQQYSEMMDVPGLAILGSMPPGTEIISTFTAGICTASKQSAAVRGLLAFMGSTERAEIKRRHGMEAA